MLSTKGIPSSTPDRRVEVGVDRKKDPYIAVAIDAEDEQVAIVVWSDFDFDPVTWAIVATIEGKANLIIGWHANDPGRYTGRGRGKQGE